MDDIVRFHLTDRNCDCCGSSDYDEIWHDRHVARGRTRRFEFDRRTVICKACGFVFVSPAPEQAGLDAYYQESLVKFGGQPPGYSAERRFDFLKQVTPSGGRLLEIGANRQGPFFEICSAFFGTVDTVELSTETASRFDNTAAISETAYDIVVHYYVLEHAQRPKEFLKQCYAALRPGGLMVCEVPDCTLYSYESSELIFWEHLSHFTPTTLTRIVEDCGFRLVRFGRQAASNPMGFLAVFRKDIESQPTSAAQCEVLMAQAQMQEARANIERFAARIRTVRQKIVDAANNGQNVTLWGANDIARRILLDQEFTPPETLRVVDDDVRKAGFMDDIAVLQPEKAARHIADSQLLIVPSRRLAARILERAAEVSGAAPAQFDVVTIDYIEGEFAFV